MLGEPITPLFCIDALRSSEPNHVRAFATSATSCRITMSFGSSALRNIFSIRKTSGETALLVPVVTRTPCGVVLDLMVDSQIFVRMLYIRHRNSSKYFVKRCLNVFIQPTQNI